jgi:hypothetical protein
MGISGVLVGNLVLEAGMGIWLFVGFVEGVLPSGV